MYKEISKIDKIELIKNCIQIRTKTSVIKDGVEIAFSYHREVITKESDTSHLDKKTQAICKLWLKG